MAVVDASAGQLVEIDELLQDCRVAPAELGWLAGQQPAIVEQQPLPATCPLRHVRDRPRSLLRLGLSRQVLVEERRELGAECLDVGVKRELHATPR